ncbi:type III secretion system export apparatus subunit SctR [Paraburkholderia sp. RL17-373-BIF-A]|uniref:type III secretion system export apparatus subunit SctR n=1 Tax=Paraburkholderia sp. RL17-373-BIF-A TaxID=3031629 RepID=UPI0038BA05D3
MAITSQSTQLISLLVVLSLLPLLVVMGTSFLKLSVVFSLLRNALGIQQIPPNIALYGLALVLSLFIMAPVGLAVQDRIAASPEQPDATLLSRLTDDTLDPYREFLKKHTGPTQLKFFRDTAHKNWPAEVRDRVSDDSLLLLIPAFAVSQLIEAFKIGLLLFLPFIAIDLIVSNVLLAMGMMMVSPMTISMPFKILVFVLVGGWDRLLDQLLLSYH